MFKKIEVAGASRVEAFSDEKVKSYFIVNEECTSVKCADQSYTKYVKEHGKTEAGDKEFMKSFLEKKKAIPGQAYYITLMKAVADTRERPYRFENVKSEGTRKEKRIYEWIDKETGLAVCKVKTTKADANAKLKEMYQSGEYKGNAVLRVSKELSDDIVAKAFYTPSKNTQAGSWIVFGDTKED